VSGQCAEVVNVTAQPSCPSPSNVQHSLVGPLQA